MNLTSISLFELSIPLVSPVEMSTGTVLQSENVLVRVQAEDGKVGWGESAASASMTGETAASMSAALEWLAPSLLKSAIVSPAQATSLMATLMPFNAAAKSTLDMALHDLYGKQRGQPLHVLLGTQVRNTVPTLSLLAKNSLEGDTRQATLLLQQGWRAFKLKVGSASLPEDIARARAVRQVLGPEILLGADANGAWSLSEASDFLAGCADAKLDFLEQPVGHHELQGLAELQTRWQVPIGLDESLHGIADLEHTAAEGLASGGSLKLIKLGGIQSVVDGCRKADAIGCQVNLAAKVAQTGLTTAAMLHIAAVIPSLRWGFSPTHGYLETDIVAPGLTLDQGSYQVPTGHGLGVTVNEATVNRFITRGRHFRI